MKNFNHTEPVKIQLADGGIGNPHPVLRVGDIYSNKYGKLTIDEKFLKDIVTNFENKSLQVEPYIDKMHERDESYGTIAALQYDETTKELLLTPAFNQAGTDTVKSGKYMYFSVDIGESINGATGSKTYPVLFGVALCNYPVFKEQPRLVAADNIGGQMEELKTALAALMGIVDSLDETQKAEAMSAIVETLGIKPEIETACAPEKEKQMSDEISSKTAEVLKLSENLSLAEKKVSELENEIKKIQFNEKYLGKKLTPANIEPFYQIYLTDAVNAEKIIANMPDLELSEKGSSTTDPIQLTDQDRAIMESINLDPAKHEDVMIYKNSNK